jgi:site-specific DNA-adenine methylase
MNNKEHYERIERTMNFIEENELREKVIFINHQNHIYIGVCTIDERGSLNKPTNKSKPL